jgi:nucleolar protein 4
VSNLPYTATSTDLQTLFSDIAPVRSAFVVLDQSTGVSKGVGYVSFGIKEDAESAFATSNEGIVLDGRKLRLQWADTKVRIRLNYI